MAKRSRPVSRPVARAPFHRGAYVHQYALSKAADQWIDQHDPDGGPLPALIGSPELGGRRGSNRSEITPAFLYHAVRDALPTDAGEPVMVTTASGETMTVDDLEHLNAEVSIDHVSQHATTAHRDRRLMSSASITRTRYVGPCHRAIAGAWVTADRWETVTTWTRDRITRDGRIVRSSCPEPCPKGCKVDHRHVRHQHRDAGTLYVHQTAPYGDDGLARQGQGPRVSKRQGRRVRRVSLGSWTDATYRADSDHQTAAAVVMLPEVTAVQGHNVHVGDGVAMLPAPYIAERETLAETWARVPFVPVKVRAERPGPAPAPLATLDRTRLLRRIAADPDLTALAGRVLLAAEHAWTTNGQEVTAEQGLSLVVTLPPDGRPTLTITRDGTVLSTGTYKARAAVVRNAVAAIA